MISMEISSEVDSAEWNNLLDNSIDSTIFHTIEWMQVIQNSYQGKKPLYILARTNDGELVGGLPLVKSNLCNLCYLKTPYWGSPIVICNNMVNYEEVLYQILTEFYQLSKKVNTVYSSLEDYNLKCKLLESYGFKKKNILTHILRLEKSIDLTEHDKLSKYTRKNIRLAKKNGVVIEEVKNLNQVKQYYDISVDTYMRRNEKSGYPLNFYKNIFEIMGKKGLIRWHLAKKEETILAGTLHFIYKDMVFDLLNAAYSKYWDLRPNFLLVWSMIIWASENNYEYYNFGSSPPEARGLIEFKERWGAERKDFIVYTYENSLWRPAIEIYRLVKRRS